MKPRIKKGKTEIEKLERSVRCLIREKGQKALEIAKEAMLKEIKAVSSQEARQATRYFISEYWNDLTSPTLISLGCEAVGGDLADTIPVAIPVILISGAVDIHDDIIDKSKTKYGRLTVLGKYGKDFALLVGDALLIKGFTLLHAAVQRFPQKKFLIMNVIKNSFFELGDAEALELKFRKNLDTMPQEYIHAMTKKAADVEGLLRIGAIIGNGSTEEIDALGYYGRSFGLLSILRDDWIDIIDYKEAKHRLQFENLPLPILYALQNPKAKSEIKQILRKGKVTGQDIQKIFEITEKYEGFRQSRETMLSFAKKAKECLDEIKTKTTGLRTLLQFVTTIE